MMNLPRISSYGHYTSTGYGAHCLLVQIGDLDVYFSYQTVVAFRAPGFGLVVRRNSWGPTTGKHLMWIDGGDRYSKRARLDADSFQTAFEQAVIQCGFNLAQPLRSFETMVKEL